AARRHLFHDIQDSLDIRLVHRASCLPVRMTASVPVDPVCRLTQYAGCLSVPVDSVILLAGINLVDPRRYPAADVGGIGETGPFQYRQRFGRTFSGFAVQHSGAVAGNVGQGRAVKEFALGYEFRSGNLVDLALIGLTHVNEYEIPDAVVALFQPR